MRFKVRLKSLVSMEGVETDSAVLIMKARSELIQRNVGNHMVYPDKTLMLRDDQITVLRSIGFDIQVLEQLND